MKLLRSSLAGFLCLLACCLCPQARAQSLADLSEIVGYRPVVGEPHPQLILPNIESQQAVSLAQFRGKKVLLIHFASW